MITIDAIGTQEEIANKIVYKKKTAYILKVKDNQKNLKDDIKTYFDLELKGNSIDNLAIIRKISFNIDRLDSSMRNLTLKKKLHAILLILGILKILSFVSFSI